MGFNGVSLTLLRFSVRPSSTGRETWVRMRSDASTCLRRWDLFSLMRSLRMPTFLVFGTSTGNVSFRLTVTFGLSLRMKQLSKRSCAGSDSLRGIKEVQRRKGEYILEGAFTQMCRSSSERSPAKSDDNLLLGLKGVPSVGGCLEARSSIGKDSETRKRLSSEAEV